MDLLKSVILAVILTGCIAMVVGSQGTSAGPMAIFAVKMAGHKAYWSWPVFFGGTGLAWSLMLLQR